MIFVGELLYMVSMISYFSTVPAKIEDIPALKEIISSYRLCFALSLYPTA